MSWLFRELDIVIRKIAVDYYDIHEIQNDVKDITCSNPDLTTGLVLQDTYEIKRKMDFFSFMFDWFIKNILLRIKSLDILNWNILSWQ